MELYVKIIMIIVGGFLFYLFSGDMNISLLLVAVLIYLEVRFKQSKQEIKSGDTEEGLVYITEDD